MNIRKIIFIDHEPKEDEILDLFRNDVRVCGKKLVNFDICQNPGSSAFYHKVSGNNSIQCYEINAEFK